MKVFIVFLGLCIINVSFLSYQGDMGRYVKCQRYLKAVAEECAAGAALYYDESEYADGIFQFNYEEGKKYIEYTLTSSKKISPLPLGTEVSYDVVFRDDVTGYDSMAEREPSAIRTAEEAGTPSVSVKLTAETKEDLFHLPFLEVIRMKRAAKYELPQ